MIGGRRGGGALRAGLAALALVVAWASQALSFCHEVEVARLVPAAAGAPAAVVLEWFGHSTFQITSSKGTRILTDPHGRSDLPAPRLPQHIVTASHPHAPHSSVWMAPGKPIVLHGLTPGGESWSRIHTTIRDVSVYVVPSYHDKSQGLQRGKNAIFVFRVDDVCIAHLGDLGHILTPEQLRMMGKIDVLLVPIAGGLYTITAQEAREVTRQVGPRIAIPKHYWWEEAVGPYVEGQPRVRQLGGRTLSTSKRELPPPTEIVVLDWGRR